MPTFHQVSKLPQKAQNELVLSVALTFVPFLYGLNSSPAGNQVDKQNDHGNHEQQVNEAAADI